MEEKIDENNIPAFLNNIDDMTLDFISTSLWKQPQFHYNIREVPNEKRRLRPGIYASI